LLHLLNVKETEAISTKVMLVVFLFLALLLLIPMGLNSKIATSIATMPQIAKIAIKYVISFSNWYLLLNQQQQN
jgi:hypothetical protein